MKYVVELLKEKTLMDHHLELTLEDQQKIGSSTKIEHLVRNLNAKGEREKPFTIEELNTFENELKNYTKERIKVTDVYVVRENNCTEIYIWLKDLSELSKLSK